MNVFKRILNGDPRASCPWWGPRQSRALCARKALSKASELLAIPSGSEGRARICELRRGQGSLASFLLVLLLLTGCAAQGTQTIPAELQATPVVGVSEESVGEVMEEGVPDEEEVWMLVNAREYLSLRDQPDTKADRIKKLPPGAWVRVLERQGEFAYVTDTAGESGYVLWEYLIQGLGQPPVGAEDVPPQGICVVWAEEYVSLRKEPDTQSARIRKMPVGEVVTVLGIEGNFAYVQAEQGETGYALHQYLRVQTDEHTWDVPAPEKPVALEGERYVVANVKNYLSLRIAPDGEAERIKKLYPGTVVALLRSEGSFAYVQEEGTGDTGYVLASRLLPAGDYHAPSQETVYRYADVREYLSLREKPDTQSERIARIQPGERVLLLESIGAFAKVRLDSGQEGFVLEMYLSKEPPAPQKAAQQGYIILAKEYVTLRQSASSSAKALKKLPAGSSVELIGYDGLYAHVEAQGNRGYVLSGYIGPSGSDSYLSGLSVVKPAQGYDYRQMMSDLAALKERYSIRVESIGKTVSGLDIPVAVLGDPSAEHHILIQAAIHGREHMTTQLVMAQLEALLAYREQSYMGYTYSDLLKDVCLHIVPMANPDGVAISQQGKGTDVTKASYAFDTKNGYTDLSYEEYLRGWKANANGVDLNRNFNAGWKSLASRSAPSSSHYKGKTPADQPEAKALSDYAKRYDFDVTISYHAYGSMLYWDYPADKAVREQSSSLAKAVRAVTRYPLMSSDGVDSGGFKDWAMASRSIPSLTIEIGARECPLPQDEFHSIWERNRQVLPALCVWVLEQGSEKE